MENGETEKKTQKRKLEHSILNNFNKLTNGQQKIRIKSAAIILKHTLEHNEDEKELNYALGRVIRGLGSSKIHARSGFFATLVALINQYHNIRVDNILEFVDKQLHKGGGNSKSENADICAGQVLTCGAVLRSNLYERSSKEDKEKILSLIFTAGNERTYLTLAAYTFITDLFEKIDEKEFDKILLPLLERECKKTWSEQNLDTLYLLLKVEEKFPNTSRRKFLPDILDCSEIVCGANLHHVSQILTTISGFSALKHPVYTLICDKLGDEHLVEFMGNLDKTLIKNNRNKFLAVTQILTNIVNATNVPDLLTDNYVKQLLNNFKIRKDNELRNYCYKLFEKILEVLTDSKTKIKVKLLRKLLFGNGSFIFEKITKTKLIQNIIMTLKADGVKKVGEMYRKVIDKEETEKKWCNLDRLYAARLLVKLLNHPAMSENEWKIEQLIYLMKISLTNKNNELGKNLKDTFLSALDLKLNKLEELQFILKSVVMELNDNLETIASEEFDQELWEKTLKMLEKIEKKRKSQKDKNNLFDVFNTLFLHMALQIFNDSKLASDSINELINCYKRIFINKKNNENDPLWIEVVVDLFLNLLSHNSHLLRNVINCVFPHLCPFINYNAIQQILDVLNPKKNSLNNENGEDESDDDDDEDEMDVEEEEEEDVDEDEGVNEKLKQALQQVLGQDSDQESIDLNDMTEEDGLELDKALAEAFKEHKPNLGRAKKQKRSDEMLTHFRVRVLDLIEVYLNSPNVSLQFTLELMLPLLQLLEFTVKTDHQKPLQDRVKFCLKKLYKLKAFENMENVTRRILIDLLKSLLLDKGTKTSFVIQDISEQISECCIFVINSYQLLDEKQEENEPICSILKEGLTTFFNKRDCLIPYCLFKNILQLNWIGVASLIAPLMEFVFAENIRPFRRNQAVELLKIFYTNHRFINTFQNNLKVVRKQQAQFLKNVVIFFKSADGVKGKFLGNLFNLLATIKSSPIGSNQDTAWNEVGQVIQEYRSKIVFSTDTKSAFNKLSKCLSNKK